MPDIGEILEAVRSVDRELAVWRYVLRTLSDLVPRDSGATGEVVVTDDGAPVDADTIQRIHDEVLDGHIKPLVHILSGIKQLKIDTDSDEGDPEDTEK